MHSSKINKTKHNSEEMLLSAISTCYKLCYLRLCLQEGVKIVSFVDKSIAIMIEREGSSGCFIEVILFPEIIVSDKSMIQRAKELHLKANDLCYAARSCNFPVQYKPKIMVA